MNFLHFFNRPGGFGARDYRNQGQLRNNRGGNRAGASSGGFNHHQQAWDGGNGNLNTNIWAGDHQPIVGGYDRFQHQPMANSNGNRQTDQSWWDNTS